MKQFYIEVRRGMNHWSTVCEISSCTRLYDTWLDALAGAAKNGVLDMLRLGSITGYVINNTWDQPLPEEEKPRPGV